MNIWHYFTCFMIGCFLVNAEIDIKIAEVRTALSTTSSALEKFNDIITESKPGQLLSSVSRALANLGPAMMTVSAVLSIVIMFVPKQDKSELKAIKAGFEAINNKLDVLSNDIMNLESVVKLSAAKSAYARTVSVIRENHRVYTIALRSNAQYDMKYFKLHYENTYGMATIHLYDALVGRNGDFGFNLITLYSDNVKCNPVKISQFCVMGMDMINRGLVCESGYLGLMNFSAQVITKQQIWEVQLNILRDHCLSVVYKCEANWISISQMEFISSYKKYIAGDYPNYLQQIVNNVANVVPQRKWFAVAYKDSGGFREHCFSSFYHITKIWNQNNKDVTLFSTPQSKENQSDFENWSKEMDNLLNRPMNRNLCYNYQFVKQNQLREAIYAINRIRKTFHTGVVYAIDNNKSPKGKISAGYLFKKTFYYPCKNLKYLILIYK